MGGNMHTLAIDVKSGLYSLSAIEENCCLERHKKRIIEDTIQNRADTS